MSKNHTPDSLEVAVARYNASLVPDRPYVRPPYTGRSWPSQGLPPLTPEQVDAMPIADGPPELRAWNLRHRHFMKLANGDHRKAARLMAEQP